MTLLTENKHKANELDYFKNAKELGLNERDLIQRLADDYCKYSDEKNEIMRDRCMAGLLVKFWREIGKMQKKCKSVKLYEYGDLYDHLYYCIQSACNDDNTGRAWQRPNSHTCAQACINTLISSRGAALILYNSNLEKNKVNVNTVSLDAPINRDSDDAEKTLADYIPDDSHKSATGSAKVDMLVQSFVNENKLVDAIIIDTMCYGGGDTYKKSTLVKALKALDGDYEDYFAHKYSTEPLEIRAAIDHIRKSTVTNNSKLLRQIEETKAHVSRIITA